MPKRTGTFVGLDYDSASIRGVRVTRLPKGRDAAFSLDNAEQIRGSFSKDDRLTAGLALMKEKLRIGAGDQVATCVSGKQIYAAQLPFRKLTQEETRKALRLELRKSLPFDATMAEIEFQVLGDVEGNPDEQKLLVTAVANAIIVKHLQVLDGAGIKPSIVDTLPTCVANTFFEGAGEPDDPAEAHLVLHFGPSVCTLVTSGEQTPFFHRNIYFAADELYGGNEGKPLPDDERTRRIDTLADEVVRSIAYYQKNNGESSILDLHLLGAYADRQDLTQALADKTGLEVYLIDLSDHFADTAAINTADFALSLALAMRET
ncbi:MAG: pilus assembly protein PilM [Chitinispirillaceae bacterium]|jgi:Tfp pilus assembly PilM family ATPase